MKNVFQITKGEDDNASTTTNYRGGMHMVSIADVLRAGKGLPVDDPVAAIWGRKLGGNYTVETYTGTLPAELEGTMAGRLRGYKIWGNTGGAGVETAEGFKLPMAVYPVLPDVTAPNLVYDHHSLYNINESGVIEMEHSSLGYVRVEKDKPYMIFHTGHMTNTIYGFFTEVPVIRSQTYDGARHSFTGDYEPVISPVDGYLAIVVSEEAEACCTAVETVDIFIGDRSLGKDEYVDTAPGSVRRNKENLAADVPLLRNAAMATDGSIVNSAQNVAFRLIPVVEGREYSIINIYGGETSTASNFYAFFEELPQIGSVSYNERRYSFKTPSKTFVAPITGFVVVSDYYPMYDEQHVNLIPLEVYYGDASPYYYAETFAGIVYRHMEGESGLIPTDPPKVLPQIPVFEGKTNISYSGTGVQPEKAELRYRTAGS